MGKFVILMLSLLLSLCSSVPINYHKRQFETTCTYWRWRLCERSIPGPKKSTQIRPEEDTDMKIKMDPAKQMEMMLHKERERDDKSEGNQPKLSFIDELLDIKQDRVFENKILPALEHLERNSGKERETVGAFSNDDRTKRISNDKEENEENQPKESITDKLLDTDQDSKRENRILPVPEHLEKQLDEEREVEGATENDQPKGIVIGKLVKLDNGLAILFPEV